MSTTDIAMANLGRALARKPTAEELEIARGIDATIRAVAADRYNPVWQPASPTVTVASGVKTSPGLPLTGWAKEVPIESPLPNGSLAERVIGALCDQALGPAVPKGKAADES